MQPQATTPSAPTIQWPIWYAMQRAPIALLHHRRQVLAMATNNIEDVLMCAERYDADNSGSQQTELYSARPQ